MRFMAWKVVDPAKIHRLFYPQVPIVITAQFEHQVGGMPAIWCMPLSFNPALVGVAVAPEHETHKIITHTHAFAMNWLDFSYAKQVGELGEISAKVVRNKIMEVGFSVVKGTMTGQPLIKEASAVLECQLIEKHQTGTHDLLVGKVILASAENFDDYWDFSKYNPLLYAGTIDDKGKSWLFKSARGEAIRVPITHQA